MALAQHASRGSQSQSATTISSMAYADELYYLPVDEQHVATDADSGVQFVDNEILVYADGATQSDILSVLSSYGPEVVGRVAESDSYQIRLNKTFDYQALKALAKQLMQQPGISYASADLVTKVSTDQKTSDPFWDEWSSDGGAYHASDVSHSWGYEAIHLPEAWNLVTADTGLWVGVYDNKFYCDHKDLGNLRTDDVLGFSQFDLSGENPEHGTHVAGIIGADGNNNTGMAGVAYGVQMAGFSWGVEITDYENNFKVDVAMAWFKRHNCRVINMSVGWIALTISASNNEQEYKDDDGTIVNPRDYVEENSEYYTKLLLRYIDRGYDFLICKSAGNEAEEGGLAEWDILGHIDDAQVSDHIIVVGAADYSDSDSGDYKVVYFSDGGARVDVIAPGVDIWSTVPVEGDRGTVGSSYAFDSGTSMATPIVTGIAALMLSANPDLTATQLKGILIATTSGKYTCDQGGTYGMVDAAAAVKMAQELRSSTEATSQQGVSPEEAGSPQVVEDSSNAGSSAGSSSQGNSTSFDWQSYLSSGAWKSTFSSMSPTSYSYALHDLDGDGVSELLICGNLSDRSFKYSAIFKYTGGQVVVADGPRYGWGTYAGCVLDDGTTGLMIPSDTAPTKYVEVHQFCKLQGGSLVTTYTYIKDEGSYYLDKNGSKTSISQSDFNKYSSRLADFDWQAI